MDDLPGEEWRGISEFDDFEISSLGRVRYCERQQEPQIIDPMPVRGKPCVQLPNPESDELEFYYLTDLMREWVEANPAPGRYVLQQRRGPWYDARIENLAWVRIPGQKRIDQL